MKTELTYQELELQLKQHVVQIKQLEDLISKLENRIDMLELMNRSRPTAYVRTNAVSSIGIPKPDPMGWQCPLGCTVIR